MEVDAPHLPCIHYLSVDPGLKNCCAAIIRVDNNTGVSSVVWQKTYDLSGGSQPDIRRAYDMIYELKEARFAHGEANVVVEYQPPLRKGGIALVRHNCWIEGYVIGAFHQAIQVHPSACKQFWKVRSGDYRTNKALAVMKARTLVSNPEAIKKDHEADCVLNALYVHKHRNPDTGFTGSWVDPI